MGSAFVTVRTILSRSSSELLGYLDGLRKMPNQATTLFYALSSNASELQPFVSRLSTLCENSVGCLSSPLQTAEGVVACSLAFLKSDQCIPFRIDPGMQLSSRGGTSATTILYFSDSSFDGNFEHYLNPLTFGLVGASTPFVTGKPFTLMHNDKIYSDGAVGIALRDTPRPRLRALSPLFQTIKTGLTVTSAGGNLVHQLNGAKATRSLLEAIHDARLNTHASKDDEFFLSVQTDGGDEIILPITSGDPARGSISVDSSWGPSIGSTVKLLHRPHNMSPEAPWNVIPTPSNPLITFSPSSLENLHQFRDRCDDDWQRFPDCFFATSDNGFHLKDGKEVWKCKSSGILAALDWQ